MDAVNISLLWTYGYPTLYLKIDSMLEIYWKVVFLFYYIL